MAMGGDLHAVDYDARSAMHLGCAGGHSALVAFLLDHGCDPNARDSFGRTPLDEARLKGTSSGPEAR
jgi:ankyrin repeat protein